MGATGQGVSPVSAEGAEGPQLSIRDLVVSFGDRPRRPHRAVDGVDLDILPGETVGLVGESGSGKSTIGKAVLGLVPVTSGHINFEGQEITHLPHAARRNLARDIQVVFQDPYSSLNPSKPIGETLIGHNRWRVYGSWNTTWISRARLRSVRKVGDLLALEIDVTAASRVPAPGPLCPIVDFSDPD